MSGISYNTVRMICVLAIAFSAQQALGQENASQPGQETVSQEKAAREKAAQEKAAQEKAAQERAAQERAAQERAAREKAAREKAAQEKAAQEKAAQEKAGQKKVGQDQKRIGQDKAAQEKAAQEKAAQEKAAQEKAAREKAAQEKAAQEKAAQEKAAQEKAAQEKAAQEKAAREKAAQEKAAQEKAAQEKAAQEKAAQEKAAQEKAAREKAGQEKVAQDKDRCDNEYSCIGMTIDSGDPVLIQMGQEMSALVSDKQAGTVVKPTAGPIENVARLLSRENAGLTVVPSDMLHFTDRSDDPRLRRARDHLRFIMTIGKKVVHVIVRNDIKRLEDLQGKKVVMGPDNTAIWVVSNNILNMRGVKPSERIQLKPPEAIKAVLSGEAEAAFLVGDPPMQKLVAMRESADLRPQIDQVHMLELKLPLKETGYQSATVNYPGFAENVETVAILPTLISYNFAEKSTPYFRRRCGELTRIGETVRTRLAELRASGHKQWNATSWAMDAGNWQKDTCFLGPAQPQIASGPRSRRAKMPAAATQAKRMPARRPVPLAPDQSSAMATVPVGRQNPAIGRGKPTPQGGVPPGVTDNQNISPHQ